MNLAGCSFECLITRRIINGTELVAYFNRSDGVRAAVRDRQNFRADGDVAKGIKSFKKGLTEEWEDEAYPYPKVGDYQDSKPPARPKSVRSRKLVQKLGRAGF